MSHKKAIIYGSLKHLLKTSTQKLKNHTNSKKPREKALFRVERAIYLPNNKT